MTDRLQRFQKWDVHTHIDGTRIFKNRKDRRNEERVAKILAEAWNCEVHSWGELALIDWYFVKNGRPEAVGELKCRENITSTDFDTVYLKMSKYNALLIVGNAHQIRAFFVVEFKDGLFYISIYDIVSKKTVMAGWNKPRAKHDNEPILHVPVADMRRIEIKPKRVVLD